MIGIGDLPAVNAGLNATCTVLLVAGWVAVRRGRHDTHKKIMLAAVATSALFLTSYLTYHAHAGSTPFPDIRPERTIYLAVLLTHTVLAAAVVPLVGVTLYRAFKDQRPRHRKIARWTLPIWLYVSVTGVLIYFALYHWYRGR